MQNLDSYFHQINEAIDVVKVVMLYDRDPEREDRGEEPRTPEQMLFEDEFKKRKISFRTIDIMNAILESKGGSKYSIDDHKESPFTISTSDTVILIRGGAAENYYTENFTRKLELEGFFLINPLDAIKFCNDKYASTLALEAAGVPVPKTIMVTNTKNLEPAVEAVGGKFPLIVKMVRGTHGLGVSIIESMESLKSVLDTIWTADENADILLQEKIENDYDIRVHVLTKKFIDADDVDDSYIIGSMKRTAVEKDFRTNISTGGKATKVKITDDHKQIAIEAARISGCKWCGVDLMVDKKTGGAYVLEVNGNCPGVKGITELGIDIVPEVVDYLIDKSNWGSVSYRAGLKEIVNVNGLFDCVGRLTVTSVKDDAMSTLYVDSLIIKGKNIEIDVDGNKFTFPVEITDSNPYITLNIEIGSRGPISHDFLVNERGDIDRYMDISTVPIRHLGLIVDPSTSFVMTSFGDDDKYKSTKNELIHVLK